MVGVSILRSSAKSWSSVGCMDASGMLAISPFAASFFAQLTAADKGSADGEVAPAGRSSPKEGPSGKAFEQFLIEWGRRRHVNAVPAATILAHRPAAVAGGCGCPLCSHA